MRTWFGILSVVSVFLCLAGYPFAADDPPKNQEEPPVRLKKKVKPEQPAAPEKK